MKYGIDAIYCCNRHYFAMSKEALMWKANFYHKSKHQLMCAATLLCTREMSGRIYIEAIFNREGNPAPTHVINFLKGIL